MKKDLSYAIFYVLILFFIVFLSTNLMANQEKSAELQEEVDISKLKKINNEKTQEKIDVIKPKGGGAKNGQITITEKVIEYEQKGSTNKQNLLIGSSVKFTIKPSFNFGVGNIRDAYLVWSTSNNDKSVNIILNATGGIITNFSNICYESTSNKAGAFTVNFTIFYKVFGSNKEFSAISPSLTLNFIDGSQNPDQASIDQNLGPNNVTVPPGVDTPPGTKFKDKIPLNFTRKLGGPNINERENYTWQWKCDGFGMPTSQPGNAYAYAIAAVKRGGEIESNDETGVDSIPANESATSYVPFGGRFYKKGVVDIGGDGPLPNPLKGHWDVRYPSAIPQGVDNFKVDYNLSKTTAQGDSFTYAMPEPSEPFKVAVVFKVEHIWRDFGYKSKPNNFPGASKFYADLKSNKDPLGIITEGGKYKDITTTLDGVSASGGVGNGPADIPVNVTVTGSVKYMELVKTGEKDVPNGGGGGGSHKEDIMEWKGHFTAGRSQTFGAGAVTSDDKNQFTNESFVHEKVLDTTAPKIEIMSQASTNFTQLSTTGDIVCSTGDLINVRVKISDNNRYTTVRRPYITYETAPSGNNSGKTWSSVPLEMAECPPPNTAPSENMPRPFESNFGFFQTLVPAPHSIKGVKALRWYIDAFDKASSTKNNFINQIVEGNYNHGNFDYDGAGPNTQKVETNYAKTGTLSIYDNDRPNINVKMWKVDRAGTYLVGDFFAGEDYMTEDFYYNYAVLEPADIIDAGGPANEYKAKVPPDTPATSVSAALAILGNGAAGIKIPGLLFFPPASLFPLNKQAPIVNNLKDQIEDPLCNYFNFQAGYGNAAVAGLKSGNCLVIFEDIKYIFTVDAADNIESVVNNGNATPIPRQERTKISFQLQDGQGIPLITAENMEFKAGQINPVGATNVEKLWYLGPDDPSIPPLGESAKDVPSFEYVFHSVSADNSTGNRFMKINAVDRCGLQRNMRINFKVNEVSSELRILEEKIKREHKNKKIGG